MASMPEYRHIFRYTLDALEQADLSRRDLINEIVNRFALSREELDDHTLGGRHTALRSLAGSVINDMNAKGIITFTAGGVYKKNETNLEL